MTKYKIAIDFTPGSLYQAKFATEALDLLLTCWCTYIKLANQKNKIVVKKNF